MGNTPTPLRKATRWNETSKVAGLLERAGPKAADLINEDYSPDCIMDSCSRVNGNAFYYAVSRNRLEIMKMMLEHGADVTSTGDYGETCLHAAVRQNYLTAAKLLLDNGADLYATDDQGRYPIHCVMMTVYNTSDSVNFLLDEIGKPEDVNLRDFAGLTPLHQAAYAGNVEVVALLLNKGADVNAVSNQGNTPLHSCRRRAGVWDLLVQHGADPQATNKEGKTPAQMT